MENNNKQNSSNFRYNGNDWWETSTCWCRLGQLMVVVAGIHEYGCTIQVTPKMRAFLHRQGLHLKESTTVIKIPERSFLRTGHDENVDRIIRQTERALGQVVAGKMSVDDLLDLYGEQMATAIKKYMRDLDSPENHPFTAENKGSSNPLIDTGALLESITYRKE